MTLCFIKLSGVAVISALVIRMTRWFIALYASKYIEKISQVVRLHSIQKCDLLMSIAF